MSSGNPAPAASSRRRGLQLTYFLLAAFDILVIATALFVDHTVTSALERNVAETQTISARMSELMSLQRLTQDVIAPANDAFVDYETNERRVIYESAVSAFDRAWADIERNAALTDPAGLLAPRLSAVRASYETMLTHSVTVFSAIERGDIRFAGAHMAAMDRLNGVLLSDLEDAVELLEARQVALSVEHLTLAQRARGIEYTLAIAVILIVCAVVAYGAHLARVQRAYERRIEQSLEELERSHERLKHYADNVSHELRGPLNKMRVSLELLMTDEARPADEQREGIANAVEACDDLGRIVSGLLFLARLENMKGASWQRDVFDLHEELDEVADFFAAAADEKGVVLALDAPRMAVSANRAMVQRAVANLVSNALSHTQSGQRIDVIAKLEGERLDIVVEDNGSGMSPDHLARVFERISRGEAAQKIDGAGLGLGLPITKAIVDVHGGEVDLTSNEGRGTRVRIRLPHAAAVPA